MSRTLGAAWALCAALAIGPAHANRPLNTDTADTIAQHRCQFEPYALVNRSSGSPDEHATTLQLNCGVSASTQLGIAFTRDTAGDDTSKTFAWGGKTQLIALSDTQTGVSIGYGLDTTKTNHDGWSQDQAFAYLIATRQLTPKLLGHVNLGTLHSRALKQWSTTWAAALEWTVKTGWVLSAEAYGDDRTKPWVSAGLWWGMTDSFSVNVSAGVQAAHPRVRQLTAGFNWEF